MKNVAPRPGSLSTQIRPPWAWTILLQMARPAPVPSNSSRVCSRRKSWKIVAWNWGSMPIPLSLTVIVASSPGSGPRPGSAGAGSAARDRADLDPGRFGLSVVF